MSEAISEATMIKKVFATSHYITSQTFWLTHLMLNTVEDYILKFKLLLTQQLLLKLDIE